MTTRWMSWLIAFFAALPCCGVAQNVLPQVWNYTPVSSIQSMAVSQDGKWVAVGGFSGVQIYRQSTHQLALSIPDEVNGIVTSLAFSPDGTQLAIGHFVDQSLGKYGGAVELRSVATGKLIKQLPTTATFSVDSVAFSPDGRTLADGTRSYDSATHTGACDLELWSLSSNYKRTTLATSAAEIKSIAYSKTGTILADGGYGFTGTGTLELWNVKSSKLIETLPTVATQGVASLAISPDGKTVVDGGWTGSANYSGIVEEWDVSTGKLIVAPATTVSQVNSVAISPDGKTFADGGFAGTKSVVELWNLATGGPAANVSFNQGAVNVVGYTSDGKGLLDGGSSATLEIRNPQTLSLTSSIDTASVNFSQAIAFSADNKTLASASNKLGGVINLWTAQNGKLGAQLLSPSNKLYSIALSADNKTLADCGQVNSAATGVLELWNYATQKFLGSLPTSAEGLNSVQFSPDGKSVADGGSISNKGIVELWDVKSKSLVKTFPTQASSIHTVAFSPDGSLLAVGGNVESTGSTFTNSGVVELWNVSTGKLAASFDTNVNLVLQLAFSPDGKLFGVAGSSQTTLGAPFVAALEVWNTSKGTLADAPIITSGAHDVFSIAFSPAGKAFYIATDVDVEAFSVPKYAKLATYNPGGASSIAVSSRGNLLAVSSLIQWLAVSNIPFE